jgi:hypothetical protein
VANQYGPSITEYSPSASSNIMAVRTIAGPNTGLSGPRNVDVDAQGSIYVANGFFNAVLGFAASASGNVAPMTTYGGSTTGIAAPTAVAVPPPTSILTAGFRAGA